MCQQLHSMGFHGWAAPVGVMCRWRSTFVHIVHMILKTTYIRQHYWFLKMWILSIPRKKKQMVAVFLCSLPTECSVNDFASVHLKWVWALSESQACDFFLSMVEFWIVFVNAVCFRSCFSEVARAKETMSTTEVCPFLMCPKALIIWPQLLQV